MDMIGEIERISKQHTICTFVMSSIIVSFILLAVSNTTFPFVHGQADLVLTDNANSKNINNDFSEGLGSPFYSENTKSTNIKVSSIDPIPTVEVTYTGNSTIDGAPTQTIGTIVDKMNNDGTVSSKGQAIILTASGQVITYRSESIGNYNPDGSFSDSGIMVFQLPFKTNSATSTSLSSNSTDSLNAQFDNLFGIYKKTVDPEGNGLTKVWKWR
jgi:hypothetical protein